MCTATRTHREREREREREKKRIVFPDSKDQLKALESQLDTFSFANRVANCSKSIREISVLSLSMKPTQLRLVLSAQFIVKISIDRVESYVIT